MKVEERNYYRDLTRTAKDPFDILSDLSIDTVDMLHGYVGLVTEYGELREACAFPRPVEKKEDGTWDLHESIFEEAVDIIWYCPLILRSINPDVGEVERSFNGMLEEALSEPGQGTLLDYMGDQIFALGNLVKKACIYGKAQDSETIKAHVSEILWAAVCIIRQGALSQDIDVSPEDCLEFLIDKLEKRYPKSKGYTDELAAAREDKK